MSAFRASSSNQRTSVTFSRRYLGSVGEPQIYGTQFKLEDGKNSTQGLFNTTLIPDSLRQILGVPQLSEQDEQRKRFQKTLDAEQSP